MTSVQKREQRSMPLRELTSVTATPIASVSANLMPPEVLAKRRLGWLRRRLAFALVALVALVALGYVLVAQSTSSSRDDLVAAQSQTSLLQQRVAKFGDITGVQGATATIKSQLATVMASDVQWSALLAKLAGVAPRGLGITDVAGEVGQDDTSADQQPGGFSAGTAPIVGTLDLSGTAKDYRSIASYVDALAKVKGVGSVAPGTLGNDSGKSTFTISVGITAAALGGRFTTPGGK